MFNDRKEHKIIIIFFHMKANDQLKHCNKLSSVTSQPARKLNRNIIPFILIFHQ